MASSHLPLAEDRIRGWLDLSILSLSFKRGMINGRQAPCSLPNPQSLGVLEEGERSEAPNEHSLF